MIATNRPLVVARTSALLRPNARRVVAGLFVPGYEDLIHGQSRLNPVIGRILELDHADARSALTAVMERFGDRHRDLPAILADHFSQIAHRLSGEDLAASTQLLIGAYLTSEYALEAAALFNPSIVEHPDQTGVPEGKLRVVLSLRAVGEGHRSSIEFRTGVIDRDGTLRIDETSDQVMSGRRTDDALYERRVFADQLAALDNDAEDADFVLSALPDRFTSGALDETVRLLRTHSVTRRTAERTEQHLRWIAECNYRTSFPPGSRLDERALLPASPVERSGMEDARFVRFTDDDGTVTYHATYTAYDGSQVRPQLISTADFRTFQVSQLTGAGASNKGLALFPRPIKGRRMALSRWDRESTSLASSPDGFRWDQVASIAIPQQSWELIQIGNCGSPIETEEGWLVLTHGVGPMRSYAIGAMLLDLADPAVVRGQLVRPLIEATEAERDGYVPNVVYTCGAIIHAGRLVVPYGSADSAVGVAVVDLGRLIGTLLGSTA